MEQDRSLEQQRFRERLEQTADLGMAQLARSLGDWDLVLHEVHTLTPPQTLLAKLPSGTRLIIVSHAAVKVYPPQPLLFVPETPATRAWKAHVFDAADALELREQQYHEAMAALDSLVKDPAARPEALLRVARIYRKLGKPVEALDAYQNLADETGIGTAGMPYALAAANARCHILNELGRQEEASKDAQTLRAALLEGGWALRRETFEYYWSELKGCGIAAGEPPRAAVDLSLVAAELFDRWQSAIHASGSNSGRDVRPDLSLLIWNATSERLAALMAPSGWLDASLKLPASSADVRWKMLSPGAQPTAARPTRSLAEVQLPGRLELLSAGPSPVHNRRTVWLAGVVLMVLLVVASGYAVYRGISQELRVARLQSDFVAAVSHEFRSPLTTLRTITELLAHDRLPEEARRRQSYLFLHRETNRLHQLVEDLLDFGRMESGRKQYRIGPCDAFQLVRGAVMDFADGAAAIGFQVETHLEPTPAIVQADEEALQRAVRNLLENAMKYSPNCRTAWVDGTVNGERVSISVRDRGMGIDPREQRAIFQKFVRSDAAKKAGIKGTGIGLAMVQQIMDALGGEIRLQSSLGTGSTFTLVLPLAKD